jgi:hypothetical protein
MRVTHLIFFWVPLGIIAFWYASHRHPVVVTDVTPGMTVPGYSRECLECAGFGSIAEGTSAICRSCKGSGKGEWRFRQKGGNPTQPMCMRCSGRGWVLTNARSQCKPCGGLGYAAAMSRIRVRAEHSLWETTIATLGIAPNPNPRPQGSKIWGYPLLQKSMEVDHLLRSARVLEWGTPERHRTGAWITFLVVQLNSEGYSETKRLRIVVQDREVIDSRFTS